MKAIDRHWTRVACIFVLASSTVCAASNCASSHAKESTPPKEGTRKSKAPAVVDVAFEKGAFGKNWNDWGWAPRDLKPKQHARLNFTNYGGWILQKDGLDEKSIGGVVVDYRANASDFLELRLSNEFEDDFPAVNIGPQHRITDADGTEHAFVSMRELNPDGLKFDRFTLRAMRPLKQPWIEIDRIALTAFAGGDGPPQKVASVQKDASVEIDCDKDARPISKYIYSIAYNARLDREDAGFYWELKPPMRRWGGNPTSRYNWKHGRAWNTADDWFFQNVNFTGDPNFTYRDFLDANEKKNVETALTVPALGWVAKDTTSHSFPVSEFGEQQQAAPENGKAGNGMTPDGKPIPPGPPTRTSIKAPPEFVGEWVQAIGDKGKSAKDRLVDLYFIDNEPMLWNSTHRDVHPEPATYDELLEKSIAYGSAIRKHDPDAVIAGPAVWGWPAYFYSARDAAVGFGLSPDRISHGNTPFLEWLLLKLKEHRKKTGTRILDVLDIHFYPQGDKIYSPAGGGELDALRIRSVRSLWDPSYVDESWIKEPVELIPRMQRLIQKTDPGLKLSIGEWSFGGERRMSGGIATAEALGQFGRLGVDYAFYWTYPAKDSPSFNAFKAYRNYDGEGARFLDTSVAAQAKGGLSAFASRSDGKDQVVAILINPTTDTAMTTSVRVKGCSASPARVFQFSDADKALKEVSKDGTAPLRLPPLSVTVVEMKKGTPKTKATTTK